MSTTDNLPLPGQRVRMIQMGGEETDPIPCGALGTVTGTSVFLPSEWSTDGRGSANIYVDWDNGRSLAICTEIDQWELV